MKPSVRKRVGIAAALLFVGVLGAYLLTWLLLPTVEAVREQANVVQRKQDLLEIQKHLMIYETKYHRWPRASGTKFFEALGVPATRSAAFAARDNERFPLEQIPGPNTEALAADRDDGGSDHRTCTVVLWADGSVSALDYRDPAIAPLLDKQGRLVVGPNSPLESLRKLSPD